MTRGRPDGDTRWPQGEVSVERNIDHYKLLFPNGRLAVWYDIDQADEPIMFDEIMEEEITAKNFLLIKSYQEMVCRRTVNIGLGETEIRIVAVDKNGRHYVLPRKKFGD